jgi:hypothetical protein
MCASLKPLGLSLAEVALFPLGSNGTNKWNPLALAELTRVTA